MMKLCYQPATHEDIPEIFTQCCELVDRYEDKSLIRYDKVIDWLRNKIEKNIEQYICVMLDSQKVAYYRLTDGKDLVELDDFYVLPPFRGIGIGSAILKKCIAESCKPVFLYVFEENVRAIAFYRKHGFVKLEQVSATRFTMICRT